jgi:hypothetical protein
VEKGCWTCTRKRWPRRRSILYDTFTTWGWKNLTRSWFTWKSTKESFPNCQHKEWRLTTSWKLYCWSWVAFHRPRRPSLRWQAENSIAKVLWDYELHYKGISCLPRLCRAAKFFFPAQQFYRIFTATICRDFAAQQIVFPCTAILLHIYHDPFRLLYCDLFRTPCGNYIREFAATTNSYFAANISASLPRSLTHIFPQD